MRERNLNPWKMYRMKCGGGTEEEGDAPGDSSGPGTGTYKDVAVMRRLSIKPIKLGDGVGSPWR